MNYKDGKIAQSIIELQKEDGTWGNMFHSHAVPNGKVPLTTEQALRRLRILGFTIEDAPIRKCVDCMMSCLRGERKIDNYWEKTQDWDLFTKMMLSTWVRIFEPDNEVAVDFAKHWANILEKTFERGMYDAEVYRNAYYEEFYQKSSGPCEVDFVNFYPVHLVQGLLSGETECRMLDYVLHYEKGIYYVYGKPLCQLPKVFASLETSRYLAAINILAGFEAAKEKLGFAVDWLENNRDENGQWDLGAKARDNVYFPLSDSWRSAEVRKSDCTARIEWFLKKMG